MRKKTIAVLLFAVILLTLAIAGCSGKTYTISFESDGGGEFSPISTKGKEIITLPVPTKTGYTFDGWFYDKDTFSEGFASDTLENKKLDKDITLYAKWTKRSGTEEPGETEEPPVDVSVYPFPALTVTDTETKNVQYISSSVQKNKIQAMISATVAEWIDALGLPPYFETAVRYNGSDTKDYISNISVGKNLIAFYASSGGKDFSYIFELYLLTGSRHSSFEFVVHGSDAVILKSTATTALIDFPQLIRSYAVKAISPLCVTDNSTAANINIPKNVAIIGEDAFTYCTALTSIAVSVDNPSYKSASGILYNYAGDRIIRYAGTADSFTPSAEVKKIAPRAFYLSKLKQISVTGVEKIGSYAFEYSANLQSVAVGNSLTALSEGIFADTALAAFSFTESIKTVCSYAFFASDITAITVPSTVTTLHTDVFSHCDKLESFTLPHTLTELPDRIFEACTALTSVAIGGSMEKIGQYAFASCTALSSVSFSGAALTQVGEAAFLGCTALAAIDLPSSVENIDKKAFQNTAIESIALPTGLKTVGEYAFLGCTSLKTASFPTGLTEIGLSAFSGCTALMPVTFPESLVSIGGSAFYGCISMPYVYIPITVRELGASVFNNSAGIIIYTEYAQKPIGWSTAWKETSIPVYWDIEENSIGYSEGLQYYADDGKTIITKYTGTKENLLIPDAFDEKPVSEIATRAFYGASTLKTVTFSGSTLQKISEYAFARSSIERIYLPASVANIGAYAFYECEKLAYVATTVNEVQIGLTAIGKYAFSGCKKLASFTLPSTVTVIEEGLFSSSGLTEFSLPDSVTAINEAAFKLCQALTKINISGNTSSLSSLGSGAFLQCVSLNYIVLPTGITAIKDNTFNWCTALKSVTFNGSVTSIGNNAFSGCGLIESIALPDSLTEIGASAFYYCSALKSIAFPSSLKSIGKNAFYSCTSLGTLNIPETIETMGADVFASCGANVTLVCDFTQKPAGWNSTWNGDTKVTWKSSS